MESDELRLNDFHRIFIGSAPPEFLIEVLIRTIFIYIAFYITIRYLGKRMNGMLSVTEIVLILTLGAIIGLPMQSASEGLLQGVIVLVCAFIFQRGTNWLGFKYTLIEKFTQGSTKLLVKDGILLLPELKKTMISQEQLFIKLRSEEIFNLGKVKRMYVEASGLFSIYKSEEDLPGLSTLPAGDKEIQNSQEKKINFIACQKCGKAFRLHTLNCCDNCGKNRWTSAVI